MTGSHSSPAVQTQKEFWETKYSSSEKVWSGKANSTLIRYTKELIPKNALDMGCGEGGDAIWLAEQGWNVTAVDISKTAIDRAAQKANELGLQDKIDFKEHDFTKGFPKGNFDLITAHFFHSPIEFDKETILRQAIKALSIDGVLLIVNHASAPPWSNHKHNDSFLSSQETYDSLNLNPEQWQTLELTTEERNVIRPDASKAVLEDSIVMVRRLI